jgi:prepilin-type N-terminal cleavage/methylation domain-containing protein
MRKYQNTGFTLIELMIVLTVVGLLMALVGPLTVQSFEKAEAKSEMLQMKNWLRKTSSRAFSTGQAYTVQLKGKSLALFNEGNLESAITTKDFESIFFQPQTLTFNHNGFVKPLQLNAVYRKREMTIDLSSWINGNKPKSLVSGNNNNEKP